MYSEKYSGLESKLYLNPALSESLKAQYHEVWQKFRLPNHIALLTSGSTQAHPKMVFLSFEALQSSAVSVLKHLELNQNTIWLRALPDFHIGGLSIQVRAYLSQAILLEAIQSRWNSEVFYEQLNSVDTNQKSIVISLVPTQLYDLVQKNFQAPHNLQYVLIGGAALSDELYIQARNLGWPVLMTYGMTETSSMVACSEISSLMLDPKTCVEQSLHLPKALSHAELSLNKGQRLQIKAHSLFTQIVDLNSHQVIAQDPDGIFQAEDFANFESSDGLRILGRGLDFAKIGGESVSLLELDAKMTKFKMLSKIKEVQNFEFVLAFQEDPRLGQRVVLFIETAQLGINKESELLKCILNELNQYLLPFERPRELYFIDKIPRTALGKVMRAQLPAVDFTHQSLDIRQQ